MDAHGNNHLTKSLRCLDVVVLAVSVLGGDAKAIDTEDVAVRAHEIAPGMFSWRKFPDQINLELVRVSLSDAKKPQNGGLLLGSGREGWRLSASGLAWVSIIGKSSVSADLPASARERRAGSIDSVRRDDERKRLLATPAWKSWGAGEAISVREARAVFRLNEYSTPKMSEIKIVRLQAMFDDDAAIGAFLRSAGALVLDTGGA